MLGLCFCVVIFSVGRDLCDGLISRHKSVLPKCITKISKLTV
jgi:hypothetical protein